MSPTLKQSQAIRQATPILSSLLPGSSYRGWQSHVSVESIARDLGIGKFWTGGSKDPAIAALLERILGERPELFEPLILTIVRHGLTYRQKQGRPIQRHEIEELNQFILLAGFKFPDLWAEDFLGSLPGGAATATREPASTDGVTDDLSEAARRCAALTDLKTAFYALAAEQDRQTAGYSLEKLLNELFAVFGLEPRPPFRVTGEQIDGSFVLDYETYLLEVKWQQSPVDENNLLAFRGKVEGKSAFTRGAFISVNGFTSEAIDALVKGKQPTFFLMDGYDLVTVLESQIELTTLLRWKVRKLIEEGKIFVRVS